MTYPGGKGLEGVYQRIISLMPPHPVYIEPFLGGGAIMRLKRAAGLNIGIDLSRAAIETTMRYLSPDLTLSDETAGASAQNVEIRRRRAAAKLAIPDPVASFSMCADRSRRFEFFQTDGIAFLESYAWTGQELVYCDPPYLLETRSRSGTGCGASLQYQHEMADVDHRRFLRVVREIPARVMISGYDSPMYQEALKGWAPTSYPVMTRGGVWRQEWLWCNFPPPVELHDYRYIGSNYRERERIKRKKQRWTARLLRLPLLERQALLSAIADIDFSADARVPPVPAIQRTVESGEATRSNLGA